MTDPAPYLLHALLGAGAMLLIVESALLAFTWHKIGREVIDDLAKAGKRVVKEWTRGKRR